VVGREGDAGADGDRLHLTEIEGADPLDDRLGDAQRLLGSIAGEHDRELVPADPERLAGLTEASGDAREDGIAGRVPEAVVHPLEVVDVDQAERERPAVANGVLELAR
jgi:hypothetical protein